MQTLPTTNSHIFQAKRFSFKSQHQSPLNPSTKRLGISPTESTRLHLANLEKLIAKPNKIKINESSPSSSSSSTTMDKARLLLENLNLSRIWPAITAAEEMSPRNLNRILSKSAQYSPKNDIGSRWREYHGSNEWVGLLDPLDENLRREVIRYGEFVQAAYHAFHTNPDSSKSPRQVVNLPDRSYKVTKSLYATSSVGLPKWVDDVAPDLRWMTQRTSWIGYVAVCDDSREIQRMGRRDIVIALRGTATLLEWAENFRPNLVPINTESGTVERNDDDDPRVECGFLSLYKTHGEDDHKTPSLAKTVVHEIRRLMERYKGETLSITVTGHSLGAALSLLVADEIGKEGPPVAAISFGGPRVGNRDFADRLTSKNVKVLRVVNSQDVITKVPGILVKEKSCNVGTLKKLMNKYKPLAYSDVGAELRVDTRMSPYLKPNADVACCHDLEAYLHLVDGFLASNCPFRANAKRSLEKLIREQKSNVKLLYTGKPAALNTNLNVDDGRDSLFASVLPSPS